MGGLQETSVRIRGTTYQLRTDLPQDQVRQLADYVDETMRELDPKSVLPPQKLSVLTSLTIAGELRETERKADERLREIERRVERIARRIEEELGND